MTAKKKTNLIQIKGKRTTSVNKDAVRVGLYMPKKLIEELDKKYKAESLQALFFAFALDKAGVIDLDKETEIYLERYYDQFS